MDHDAKACDGCASGCQARHTDKQRAEDIQAGPYLLFAGAIIVLLALLFRWVS